GRDDLDSRAVEGRQDRVAETDRPCDRVRHLEMAQVVWRVKDIERPVAELVQTQIVLLPRVVNRADDEHARSGLGADDVIHDTGRLEILGRVEGDDILEYGAWR